MMRLADSSLSPFITQRSRIGGPGPDQDVKMLRHQNPADQQEMQFLPQSSSFWTKQCRNRSERNSGVWRQVLAVMNWSCPSRGARITLAPGC
jgi:hypothetical protein